MNKTNFQHAAWAVMFQSIIGFTTGDWLAGAFAGSAFFVGREHAQAEYRWMAEFNGTWETMPELAGLDYRVWDKLDFWLDWVVPTALTWFVYCASVLLNF